MSSLKAARADNFYYGPDFDPSKPQTAKNANSHPLRERAKRIGEGILVVRFEMPYDAFCEHCEHHIGRGVRFNADKKQVGKYLSTKVWSFKMRCHECNGVIEIRTDPKNADYDFYAGARKRVTEWDPDAAESIALISAEERERRAADAMHRVEAKAVTIQKQKSSTARLAALERQRATQWSRPMEANALLRKQMRQRKQRDKTLSEETAVAFGKGSSAVKLLPRSRADDSVASKVRFVRPSAASAHRQHREAKHGSIFASAASGNSERLTRKRSRLLVAHAALKKSKIRPAAVASVTVKKRRVNGNESRV